MCAASNVIDQHDSRVTIITAMALEAKALAWDESTDEATPTDDPNSEKALYAKAFQAWAEGTIEGTAEDIFETVLEVLEV